MIITKISKVEVKYNNLYTARSSTQTTVLLL